MDPKNPKNTHAEPSPDDLPIVLHLCSSRKYSTCVSWWKKGSTLIHDGSMVLVYMLTFGVYWWWHTWILWVMKSDETSWNCSPQSEHTRGNWVPQMMDLAVGVFQDHTSSLANRHWDRQETWPTWDSFTFHGGRMKPFHHDSGWKKSSFIKLKENHVGMSENGVYSQL